MNVLYALGGDSNIITFDKGTKPQFIWCEYQCPISSNLKGTARFQTQEIGTCFRKNNCLPREKLLDTFNTTNLHLIPEDGEENSHTYPDNHNNHSRDRLS